MNRVLLTGAGGFVGSHVLHELLLKTQAHIVCPVTFTHRGIPDRIRLILDTHPLDADRVEVIHTDLAAPISSVSDHLFGFIDTVINVASESHVDRSIEAPGPFIANNVSLVCNLLDWCRMRQNNGEGPEVIVQVSTDEVYGPAPAGLDHREWEHGHLPSNPYAASKAAQEDICFAYWRTYDLPIVITNTMNIIGEMQHPEKFVPMVIRNVLDGATVKVHASADGKPGSRFYLHASNQANGILHVIDWVTSYPGRKEQLYTEESLRYSQGGNRPFRFHIVGEREVDNLEMVAMIHNTIRGVGNVPKLQYELVDFHSSRPGHDLRYALDGSKMTSIGWKPPTPLDESLDTTVRWTLDHPEWLTD